LNKTGQAKACGFESRAEDPGNDFEDVIDYSIRIVIDCRQTRGYAMAWRKILVAFWQNEPNFS
jgi:hypothetical protein